MHLNRFQPGAGGHVGFLNFEALIDIFELGIQQIWIQHPLIPLEMLCTKNKHEMPSALYTSTFSEILPSLFLKIRLKQHAYMKMLIYPDL